MALLPSSALTFLNIAYFKAPVSPISFNQATYSWVEAVQGWAAAASDPATFNSLTNGNPPTYGYLISPSTGNAEQYVKDVYQNLFGSGPSAEHLTYWKNWLAQFGNNIYIGKDGTNYGIASYKALVVAVYEYATADEIAALTNRQEVSQYFSTSMQNNPSGSVPSFNTAQYNAGWASISTVTKDPASVATAKASIDQFVATTGSVGNSFVLTPNPDTKSGNQFLAPPVAGQAGGVLNTFTSGDQLTGTGTNPTLTILWQQDTANITTVQPSLLKDVSTLNATLVGNNLTVLSTFVTGLKTVNINDTSGNLTMTNLQSALETISISRSFSGSDATFTIADAALAGTEDALAIKLNQVVPAALPGLNTKLAVSNLAGTGGYEKVSVNSAGFDNTIEMAGVAGLKSLTITGDKALTLAGATSLANTVTLVDASAFNADLTVTNVAPTGNLEFKGGLKVDTFTLSATAGNHTLSGGAGDDNLTIGNNSTVKVSGGDGDDRITFTDGFTKTDVIAGDAGVNTLAFATPANAEAITEEDANITGIQTLALTTAGTGNATLRADFFGNDVNTVTLESGTVAAGAYTIRYNTGENTLNIWGTPVVNETGLLTLATNGTATTDKVTVNLVGRPAVGSNDITIGGLALNPVDGTTKLFTERLVINSSDALTVHTIVGGITLAEVPGVIETVTVTGNSGLVVFGSPITGSITADKVDASALTGTAGLTMLTKMGNAANGATVLGSLTGNNTLQGSVFNDQLTAGGAGDILQGNAGADTLTGGAGVDTFVQTAGATVALTQGPAIGGFGTATLTNATVAQLTNLTAPPPAPVDPLSGPDIVQGFQSTDLFRTGVAANYTLLAAGGAIAANQNFGIRGNYTATGTGAGTFTVNIAAGNDLLVFTAAGAGLNVGANLGTNLTVLQGGGGLALAAANFVV
ncbi:MAG: calcium-binding protein [Microcystis sp. M54BS1]|uniref:beta strand repeat-containing protein n=1 Tax=unclassified Microcystis TaxID=2643300 RepID=UPI00257D8B99|nr:MULTISPECIES: calcium-binding protein [unclassified Microcystis]MCA2540282.1 calcium-binding protein [Microcystis sp. M54BS1]MCA2597006.1 calcium-binding protein [Microcystis sp. M38BS1]MCA2609140.1 calcium-binding protein [Microcystis sp. M27BS1]MCA2505021.1 calcium-binding protein [Microcystis sp. M62BS1]MCA2511373.1 calcium-binding protein [Microcystis sp. M60BS1]